MPKILPAIFFGHGNPMNAVLDNAYTKAWARIGQTIPKPKAILSISAHWFVSETGVTIATSPRTIHDFGGFPRELFQVQCPAPGDPKLARPSGYSVVTGLCKGCRRSVQNPLSQSHHRIQPKRQSIWRGADTLKNSACYANRTDLVCI